MSENTRVITQPTILWLQVWGLAAVQGAIILCWIIYNLYLPKLLVSYGFPESLAVGIIIIENALAVLMEPLMGGISDKAKYWVGSRFPFISLGVILSSTLFLAIPCIVTFLPVADTTRFLLPLALVAWALAMTTFRSPVFALLINYALPAELPSAISVVIFVGGAVGAFRPFATNLILGVGPIFTFALGSFVLLGAAATLRLFNPPESILTDRIQTWVSLKKLIWSLGLILGTGVGVALGSRLLMDALSKLLKVNLNTNNVDIIMLLINLAIAIVCLPAGKLAVKVGNHRAMLIGISVTIGFLLAILYMGTHLPVIAIGVLAYSLIINGAIPFAFSLVHARWAGLAVGMYFAGFGLVGCLFPVVFPQPKLITPMTGVWVGAIAFLVAGACIATSHTYSEE